MKIYGRFTAFIVLSLFFLTSSSLFAQYYGGNVSIQTSIDGATWTTVWPSDMPGSRDIRDALNLGSTVWGQTDDTPLRVRIYNTGTNTLLLEDVHLQSGTSEVAFSPDSCIRDIEIEPGDFYPFEMTYSPNTGNVQDITTDLLFLSESLAILTDSNDEDDAEISLAVEGYAVPEAPVVQIVDPETGKVISGWIPEAGVIVDASQGLDMGVLNLGRGLLDSCDFSKAVFIRNLGGEDLIVEALQVGYLSDGDLTDYTIIPSNLPGSTTDNFLVESMGGGATVEIIYIPTSIGEKTALFRLDYSNDWGGDGILNKSQIFIELYSDVTDQSVIPVISSNGGGDISEILIDENESIITTVTATEYDNDSIDYSISGGEDANLFKIDPLTGLLEFTIITDFNNPIDADNDNTYIVKVTATDKDGSDSQTINVVVIEPVLYSGGSGTEADPYQIATKQDLLDLSTNTGDYDKYFIMTSDIDLAGDVYTSAIIAADKSTSDGFQGVEFSGIFNGNNHVISNMKINGERWVGLFGKTLDFDTQIINLGLENVTINATEYSSAFFGALVGENSACILNCYSTGTINGAGDTYAIGGLIGQNTDACVITNCYSSVNITDTGGTPYSLGGLVGFNYGVISSSYSTGNVECSNGSYAIGGFTGSNSGYNGSGVIQYCYSTGNVTGGNRVGGLVGMNYYYNPRVSDSYCTGNVKGFIDSYEMGGLIGIHEDGRVERCYSSGSVTCGDNSQSIGGFCGSNNYSSDSSFGYIYNCYSSSSVTCGENAWNIGGLCGKGSGIIAYSYACGAVYAGNGSGNIGGFIGLSNNLMLHYCYFLHPDDGGGPDNGNASALNDMQMKQQNQFLYWDFYDIWRIDEGESYPYLYKAPDLYVESQLSSAMYIESGNEIIIPFTLANVGNMEVADEFSVKLYRGSGLVQEMEISGLPWGGVYNAQFVYESGSETDIDYQLYLVVDEDNAISEKNEHNNSVTLDIYEKIPDMYEPDNNKEDAVMIAVDGTEQTHSIHLLNDIDWFSFEIPESSTVSLGFHGNSSQWASSATVNIYDTSDVNHFSHYNVNRYNSFDMDLPAGKYFLSFEDTDNNFIIDEYSISILAIPHRAELDGQVTFEANGENGCRVFTDYTRETDISIRIRNYGDLDAGPFNNKIYMSPNPVLNGNESLLDEYSIESLSVNVSNYRKLTLDISTMSGVYYVICVIDSEDTVDEYDESNSFVAGVLVVDRYYSGGDGTQDNPYIIATADDLFVLSKLNIDWGSSAEGGGSDIFYLQTADIDMADYDGIGGRPAFSPIGYDDMRFYGSYDGQEHTISNLKIDANYLSSDYYSVALFGHIAEGYIGNLHLENVTIIGNDRSDLAAALIGWCGQSHSVIVDHCSASGNVRFDNNSYARAGGLIARVNSKSIITDCSTNIDVNIEKMEDVWECCAGAMFGWVNGKVTGCKAEGSVTVDGFTGGYAGGFAGWTNRKANISNSYCNVILSITVSDEYSEGSIGGFVGNHGDSDYESSSNMLTRCYSTSSINIEIPAGDHYLNIGGFCGQNNGYVNSCFFDSDICNINQSFSGTGMPTIDLKHKDTFTAVGWLLAQDGGPWIIADGYSYPLLKSHYNFSGGSGIAASPYLLSNLENLLLVDALPDANYKLTADIDLAGLKTADAVIGKSFDNPFTGTFDGNGHIISNLYIYDLSDKPAGLFGVVSGEEALIKDLGIDNVDIYALGRTDVGGIVGFLNYANIENCYVTGAVRGRDYTGGLVGYANGANITNGYQFGFVDCFTFGGGLVGCCQGTTIENCYSSTDIVCYAFSGGITGAEMDSTFINSFFDLSFGNDNGLGTALNPNEIVSQDTYLDAAWDFHDETANGSDDIWHMPYDAVGTPMLWFQKDIPADFTGRYGIEISDFAMLSSLWLQQSDQCDLDSSGQVDLTELVILLENWLQ